MYIRRCFCHCVLTKKRLWMGSWDPDADTIELGHHFVVHRQMEKEVMDLSNAQVLLDKLKCLNRYKYMNTQIYKYIDM